MDGIIPKVTRLAVHEEGAHRVYYKDGVTLQSVVERTSTDTLLEWFKTNQIDDRGRDLTYLHFVERYSWDKTKKKWSYRSRGQRHNTIARMYTTHPGKCHKYCFKYTISSNHDDLSLPADSVIANF